MFSFLKKLSAAFIVAMIALMGITSPAVAQTTTTVSPAPTFSPALTFQTWNQFAGIATGLNSGGDGKGTVQTLAQGLATMTLDGSLAANTNGDCDINCNLTQSTMKLNAVIMTGATAQNQGIGNSPVSSQIGGNAMALGSMRIFDGWLAAPTTTSTGN